MNVTDEKATVGTNADIPNAMSAIVTASYGGPEQLKMQTVSTPTAGEGEVLIDVEAAGVDRGVWHLMTGLPKLVRLGFGFMQPKVPIPGFDVAGTIVAVGPGATKFAVGDEVYGIGKGTFAEYAVAPENKLIAKPTTMTWEAAGAATISGITAFEALRDAGKLNAGEKVLVLGASGGVGCFAVQIACDIGAEVVGVASAGKVDFVCSLGAKACLDYRAGNIVDLASPHGPFDVIVVAGGLNKVSDMRSLLTPDGALVLIGGEGGNKITGGFEKAIFAGLKSKFIAHDIPFFLSDEKPEIIAAFGELMAEGNITTPIHKSYALAEASKALSDMEDGHLVGKAVLRIN